MKEGDYCVGTKEIIKNALYQILKIEKIRGRNMITASEIGYHICTVIYPKKYFKVISKTEAAKKRLLKVALEETEAAKRFQNNYLIFLLLAIFASPFLIRN